MKPLYKDVIERAVWTAIQAFIAVYTVSDMETLKVAAAAGVAAGLSVIKGFIASNIGDPKTGSSLPSQITVG